MSERDWLLYVTFNNISVIYVTAHRSAYEKSSLNNPDPVVTEQIISSH